MKKIILVMILLSPFALMAQVEKGNVFIGGSLGVGSMSESPGASYTQVYFEPRVGFMINDHNAFGGGINIQNVTYNGGYKANSFGVAAFHRYYSPVSESFYFVLHSEVSLDFGKTTPFDGGGPTAKSNEVSISTGPRFAYFASKHWSFEGAVGRIGYSSNTSKPEGGINSTTSNFFINAGSVSLGVFYYIK